MSKKSWILPSVLMTFATTGLPQTAWSQSACTSVFENDVLETAARASRRDLDIVPDLKDFETKFRQTRDPKLIRSARKFFTQKGIKTRFSKEKLHPGLVIEPGGKTPIAKIAAGLANRNIELQYSLEAVSDGAAAMYVPDQRVIYFDANSLGERGPSPLLLHEVRHAIDFTRGRQPEHVFERLMLSSLQMNQFTPVKTAIPGSKTKAYSDYFSLDEVLAHRQSARNFLSILKNPEVSREEWAIAMNWIVDHSERFPHFISAWKASAEIFTLAIKRGQAEILPDARPWTKKKDDEYQWATVRVTDGEALTWFQKNILRRKAVDPRWQGLEMAILISRDEAKKLAKKPSGTNDFFLKRIARITRLAEFLEPAARDFADTVRKNSRNVYSTQAIENSMRRFSARLGESRRQLNENGETEAAGFLGMLEALTD
ncbi:MAG: hypothetical protein KF865_13755 [Bdellovibrionaceae bacterium]|nr:hypothetical protein [Pseudobdellovibrionaceae bacterium]